MTEVPLLTNARHISKLRHNLHYTEDQNERAYYMFNYLAAGESVEMSNIRRLLSGKYSAMFSIDFDNSDTGIIFWEKNGSIEIKLLEPFSPSSREMKMVRGLKLHSINSIDLNEIETCSMKLEMIQREMMFCKSSKISFQFQVPEFQIDFVSNIIDIEILNTVTSVTIEEGAYYGCIDLAHMLDTCFHKDPTLSGFRASIDEIDLHLEIWNEQEAPFRLLFQTGQHLASSCRFAIGFSANDTKLASRHYGSMARMNLGLKLTDEELDILACEVFSLFDADNSSSLEFEEFRDFYVCFLDSPESRQSLAQYAIDRFNYLEAEKRAQAELERWRLRMEKLKKRRNTVRKIKRGQRENQVANKIFLSSGKWSDCPSFLELEWGSRQIQEWCSAEYLKLNPPEESTKAVTSTSTYQAVVAPSNGFVPSFDLGSRLRRRRAFDKIMIERLKKQEEMAENKRQCERQIKDIELWKGSSGESCNRGKLHSSCSGYWMDPNEGYSNNAEIIHPSFIGSFYTKIIKHPSHALAFVSIMEECAISQQLPKSWITFPHAPCCVGSVRQFFKSVGEPYDRSEIIHPSLFGYSRMSNDDQLNSSYCHPCFINYKIRRIPTIAPITKETEVPVPFLPGVTAKFSQTKKTANVKNVKTQYYNPYQWTTVQTCFVCSGNVPGCPRCWNYPTLFTANDFSYDPIEELEKDKRWLKGSASVKERNIHSARSDIDEAQFLESNFEIRLPLRLSSTRQKGNLMNKSCLDKFLPDFHEEEEIESKTVPDDSTVDQTIASLVNKVSLGGNLAERPKIHTSLTTRDAVKSYRENKHKMMTIHVKCIPDGRITTITAAAHTTISAFQNMLSNHNSVANSKDGMLVLPLDTGIHEMDCVVQCDSLINGGTAAFNNGELTLQRYGLIFGKATVIMLYFRPYIRTSISCYMKRFLEMNSAVPKDSYFVCQYADPKPRRLPAQDVLQGQLLAVVELQLKVDHELELSRKRERRAFYRQKMFDAELIREKQQCAENQEQEKRKKARDVARNSQLKLIDKDATKDPLRINNDAGPAKFPRKAKKLKKLDLSMVSNHDKPIVIAQDTSNDSITPIQDEKEAQVSWIQSMYSRVQTMSRKIGFL